MESFPCTGYVSLLGKGFLTGKGFPDWEKFPWQVRFTWLGKVYPAGNWQGNISLIGKGFPGREIFTCHGNVSLSGKGFPARERFLSQGKVLFREGFPALEWQFPTTLVAHRIGKLFPDGIFTNSEKYSPLPKLTTIHSSYHYSDK